VLPLEHEEAENPEFAAEDKDAPVTLDAKVEIFFFVISLPQIGQMTPLISFVLRTRSSNEFSHLRHSNSNNGILIS
jgi:hypothetical protein